MQEEVRQLIEELRHAVTRPWAVMEVCGGQTHAIASLGLEELLPPGLRLIHGPGCRVPAEICFPPRPGGETCF